jgi:hypothetical protein
MSSTRGTRGTVGPIEIEKSASPHLSHGTQVSHTKCELSINNNGYYLSCTLCGEIGKFYGVDETWGFKKNINNPMAFDNCSLCKNYTNMYELFYEVYEPTA